MGYPLVWLAAAALAHPVGDGVAAQSTAIVVRRDRVEVDYYADVPELLVRTARPGAQDPGALLAAMLTELRTGLVLAVDGEQVPLRDRTPPPAPAPSSEHTLGFALHLQADLPAGARRIEVSTANLVDTQSVYAGDVRVGPGLVVQACSLLPTRPDGRIGRDDTLRWTRGEDRRVTWVALGRPRPRWWPILAGEPGAPRRAAEALPVRASDALRAGRIAPGTLAGAVALAVGLGAARGRDGGPPWAWAVAVFGVGLALAAGWAAVEAGAAVAVAGVAALGARGGLARGLVAPIAVGALAAATHAPVAAALVVAVGAAASAAIRSPGRRSAGVQVALALGVAAILAVRAAR